MEFIIFTTERTEDPEFLCSFLIHIYFTAMDAKVAQGAQRISFFLFSLFLLWFKILSPITEIGSEKVNFFGHNPASREAG
jgi:hypothetical protein